MGDPVDEGSNERDTAPARYRSVESGTVLTRANIVYRAWKGGQEFQILEDGVSLNGERYVPLDAPEEASE